jgi:hypothetical protein
MPVQTEAPSRKSWRDVLPIHPAAELFPLPPPDELKALGEDIVKNNLTSSVVLWRAHPNAQAQLLDGRSRLDAIEIATGSPAVVGAPSITAGEDFLACDKVVVLDKTVDPFAYVVSANVYRRHLSTRQKRELIAKLIKATPDKSDRQIAKTVKASPTTVGTVRAEIASTVQSGQLSEKRVGKDGRARKQPVKKATTAKSPRAAQRKATETETEARKPKPRDDIGPNNSSEAERLRERNEELENENACLRRENLALRTEIDELKARLHTVSPPADDGLDVPEFLRRTAP